MPDGLKPDPDRTDLDWSWFWTGPGVTSGGFATFACPGAAGLGRSLWAPDEIWLIESVIYFRFDVLNLRWSEFVFSRYGSVFAVGSERVAKTANSGG